MTKLAKLLIAVAAVSVMTAVSAKTVTIQSPGNTVRAEITDGEHLSLDLFFNDQPVLADSTLGFALQKTPAFGEMTVLSTETKSIDQTWENRFGRNRTVIDRANETTIHLAEKTAPGRKFDLVLRAYDDGFALRYVLLGGEGESFVLSEEKTAFRFAADIECWATDNKKINTSHENIFQKLKISELSADAVYGLPLVATGDFGYAALAEAAVFDWPAAHFRALPKTLSVSVALTPRHDENGLVVGKFPCETPWRVVLLGKSAIDLVNNSGVILNLNPPCQIADTDWIVPGASSWDWWSWSNTDLSTEMFKKKVDFSVEMGWPYTTLDDPWYGINHLKAKPEDKPDILTGSDKFDFDEGIGYAKSKGIGVFLWLHKDDLDACGVEKAFKFFSEQGIVGLKIDFFDREDQEIVEWINATIQMAAKYRLMVNYHGIYQPTGTNRTWPNFVTQEGILGNEYNKFGSQVTPTHATTLPYTRFLLGPGDFTPGGFVNVHPENFEPQPWDATRCAQQMGTRAYALAQCVLYDSPAMTICDCPDNYHGQKGLAMLKNLPAVWDESRALAGEIGEYFVMARRSGDTWYLSAITNEKARTVEIPLDFLPENSVWNGTLYADAPESDTDALALEISEKPFTAGETLTIKMCRDGGFNAIFTRP